MTEQEFADLEQMLWDFDDFAWCKCSECRHGAESHGADTVGTIQNLVRYLRERLVTRPSAT